MHPSVAQGVAARHSDVKNATSSVRRENYLFLTFYQPYCYISTFFTGKKKCKKQQQQISVSKIVATSSHNKIFHPLKGRSWHLTFCNESFKFLLLLSSIKIEKKLAFLMVYYRPT